MICWGGPLWTYQSESTLAGWVTDGHQGYEVTWDAMYAYGGLSDFIGSDASSLGSQYGDQQRMEGAAGTVAGAISAGMETYLGFYTNAEPGFGDVPSGVTTMYGSWPPYGNWWDDTSWSGVAAAWETMARAAQYMGMTGMAFDSEPPCWIPDNHQYQQVTVSGSSGSFALQYGGQTTGNIAYSASTPASTIQNALQSALTGPYGAGVVNVAGPDGGPYAVVFAGGGFIGAIDEMSVASQSGVTVTIADYTASQVNTQARARGNAVAQAMWGAFPGMVLLWYHCYPQGGWNDKIESVLNGAAYPHTLYAQDYFFEGMLDGMRAVAATGRICLADATFYRDAGIWISGATNQNAYFLNSQASRSQISRFFDQSVWNYACDHFDIAGFTFRGGDGTSFYDNTQPSDSAWAQSVMDARAYSEGPRRVEYQYSDGWSGGPQYPAANSFSYSTATMLGTVGGTTGSIPASNTAALSTSVPTVTNLSTSLVGGVVTITCNAAHAYGIRCVKVYDGTGFNPANPSASYLGAMQMTFEANGGSCTTNYDGAYQACTFQSSGTNGQSFVLEAISIKDDTHWAVAQAAGSVRAGVPIQLPQTPAAQLPKTPAAQPAQAPPAQLPETPATWMIPASALFVLGGGLWFRRRRRDQT
jgi:hypothetical protein